MLNKQKGSNLFMFVPTCNPVISNNMCDPSPLIFYLEIVLRSTTRSFTVPGTIPVSIRSPLLCKLYLSPSISFPFLPLPHHSNPCRRYLSLNTVKTPSSCSRFNMHILSFHLILLQLNLFDLLPIPNLPNLMSVQLIWL